MDSINKAHQEVYNFLDSQKETDVQFLSDNIKSEGISVRVGTKLLKFELASEESLPIDDLKNEFNKKFQEKLIQIKKYIESNLIESYQSIEIYKQEAEKKKEEYEQLIKKDRRIPELDYEHIKKGLSVCKDGDKGLVWLYRGIYAPKYFYDNNGNTSYISPNNFKELITPILIQIKTIEEKVMRVNVLDIFGNKFKHYHDTGGDDCWGDWKTSVECCLTPSDIINIAEKAIKILETINENSPGNRNPSSLPRMSTLKKNIISELNKEDYNSKKSGIYKRMGLVDVDYDIMKIKRHQNSGWSI